MAADVAECGVSSNLQSVSLSPAVIRIAEAWSTLPPHIREAIQTLVEAALPAARPADPQKVEILSEEASRGSDEVAWRIAKECRSIVQGCLREEEWQDADREFFEVIASGFRGRIGELHRNS
jgi:DNA-binding FadR family transcriptional regulator